jgi:hypothetical protein
MDYNDMKILTRMTGYTKSEFKQIYDYYKKADPDYVDSKTYCDNCGSIMVLSKIQIGVGTMPIGHSMQCPECHAEKYIKEEWDFL